MKFLNLKLLITIVVSLGLGALGVVPIVQSENGYVAGYIVLPLFFLLVLACLVLFIVGIAFLCFEKKAGFYLLVAMLMLPVGFLGSALLAKHFEIGAYRVDPIDPMTPEISNIVFLNKNVTNAQINSFWNETLATEREDGRGHTSLPGIHGVGGLPAKEGHEVVEFSFFPNATEEQREFVYSRVRASPIVFKLLENVSTKDYTVPENVPSNDSGPEKGVKIQTNSSNTHQ